MGAIEWLGLAIVVLLCVRAWAQWQITNRPDGTGSG